MPPDPAAPAPPMPAELLVAPPAAPAPPDPFAPAAPAALPELLAVAAPPMPPEPPAPAGPVVIPELLALVELVTIPPELLALPVAVAASHVLVPSHPPAK